MTHAGRQAGPCRQQQTTTERAVQKKISTDSRTDEKSSTEQALQTVISNSSNIHTSKATRSKSKKIRKARQ